MRRLAGQVSRSNPRRWRWCECAQGRARWRRELRCIGLSTAELVALSRKVNHKSERHGVAGTPADEAIEELVDLFYTTRKQGGEIQSWVGRFTFNSAQLAKLRGAALPRDGEVALVLDYICGRNLFTGDDLALAYDHLPSIALDPDGVILSRLQLMHGNRSLYRQPNAYVTLFRALAEPKVRRAVQVLDLFADDADPWVRQVAREELRGFTVPRPPR